MWQAGLILVARKRRQVEGTIEPWCRVVVFVDHRARVCSLWWRVDRYTRRKSVGKRGDEGDGWCINKPREKIPKIISPWRNKSGRGGREGASLKEGSPPGAFWEWNRHSMRVIRRAVKRSHRLVAKEFCRGWATKRKRTEDSRIRTTVYTENIPASGRDQDDLLMASEDEGMARHGKTRQGKARQGETGKQASKQDLPLLFLELHSQNCAGRVEPKPKYHRYSFSAMVFVCATNQLFPTNVQPACTGVNDDELTLPTYARSYRPRRRRRTRPWWRRD